MLNWLTKRIQEEALTIWNQWLGENEERLRLLKTELADIKTAFYMLNLTNIHLKVPIEEYVYTSTHFQKSLERALHDAERQTGFPMSNLKPTLANLHGTVSADNPFEHLTDELIVVAGLKTHYTKKDVALFDMQIGDKRSKPLVIDKETKQLIFLQHYFIHPDVFFQIRQLKGHGDLQFSIIGATISPWSGL